MLTRRLRRRPNIEPALSQRLVFAGYRLLESVAILLVIGLPDQ